MTTAALTSLASPLSFVTAETALAAYQMACATGAAGSFEAAAHALAGALRCERARRMAPRPPAGVRPRLVVDNDPTGEAAPAPVKSLRKAARPAVDLDTRIPAPKRNSPAGSFLVEWSDGSTTRVQGVSWAAAKPETRWAKAYQAANRVRRARFGRLLSAEMGGPDGIRGRYAVGPCGVQVDSPAWLELLACTPLPALVAVVDETLGTRFEAPAGTSYGAGDEARAVALTSELCAVRLPWLEAEAAKVNDLFRTTGEGVSYWIRRGEGEDAIHGVGVMSPWPDAYRRHMIHNAQEAFAEPVQVVAEPALVLGAPVEATDGGDIAGRVVTLSENAWQAVAKAETTAGAAYAMAEGKAASEAKKVWDRALARRDAMRAIHGLAWTVRRVPGGGAMLMRPGRGVVIHARDLNMLHLIANPAA